MEQQKRKKFTKYITLGWWLSFAFFIVQALVISIFDLPATPIIGLLLFASFVVLSFSSHYDKENEFSPYKGLKKILKKRKN